MSALPEPRLVREYAAITAHQFAEIRAEGQPAVLRNHASNWPGVQAACRSDEDLVEYLRGFIHDRPVPALVGNPEIEGRFFYSDDMRGFNFQRVGTPLRPFLDRLLKDRAEPRPYSMAVQSETIPHLLPGFEVENRVTLLGPAVEPRAWIGNRIRVAPHYDLMENVGVVVAGRRRFTFFPPEQIANLYVGPIELTPAGTPVSMVDMVRPDLERFPRYADAAATAQQAILEPGDAIYIPYHWWHGVESLEGFNLFVNYWWNDASSGAGNPFDALMHAFFAIRPLPPEQRDAWRKVLDYYIFQTDGDPAAHLPPHARGMLGQTTPAQLGRMRATLKQILTKL